jgi:hypothetical protein
MQTVKLFLFFPLIILCKISFAQNVGINTTTPQAALDVYGDIIHRSANLIATDGTTTALDVNNNKFSYYRINGPTANFTLAGITEAVEGRLVTLFNVSGFVMQLNNLDPAASVNDRIVTGTNADLTIEDRGIVNLQYDGAEQKWIVVSNNKNSGGGGWALNGNSGTNPTNDFIGTIDNQPFTIKSNNQTVAAFQYGSPSNNYIGTNFQRTGVGIIGTGAPTHTLEVGLADLVGGSQGALGIRGTSFMSHFNYSATEDVYIRGGKAGSNVIISDIPTLGNVAIGTNIPDANTKLTLQTATDFSTALSIRNPSGSAKFNAYVGGSANGNTISLGTPGAMPIAFYTNSANRMFITAGGNVGIGTDNPTNKLSVYGNIRSTEVIVETANWPDYVFHKKYPLQSLVEVEKYIQQNNHLPNIPSANEIEKSGLQLGDMQKKMMEKIEELTLYIIQQQKEIELLKERVNNYN